MGPGVEESPVGDEDVVGCRLVFDLVYHPLETRLLKQASAAGCATLNGLDMFVRQAAAQFERWTGVCADTTTARIRIGEEIRRSTVATP